MQYNDLKDPVEMEFGGRMFAISRIPALKAVPIFDVVSAAVSERGVMGLTSLPVATQKAILQFVLVRGEDGTWSGFETDSRINNAFAKFETLIAVVLAMVRENFGFLTDGRLPDLLREVVPQEAESAS